MSVFKKIKNYIHSKRIKGILKDLKSIIKDNYEPYMLWMCIPFILMDVFIFIFGSNISYISYNFISPLLFTISWIFLFVGVSLCFKEKP